MGAGVNEPNAPDGPAGPGGEANRTGGHPRGGSADRPGTGGGTSTRGRKRTPNSDTGERRGRSAADPGPDGTFEALSNRRRYALHYLGREGDGPVDVGTVAEHVAAWEYGKPMAELERAERKRVRTALRQFHLPKLDTHGFVKYDEGCGEVCLGESAPELDVYADVVSDRNVPRGPYYVCLSCLGGTALSATRAGVAPFEVVPTGAWAALFVGAVLVSGVVRTWYESRTRLGVGEKPPELRM
jgi:hypothetical protein